MPRIELIFGIRAPIERVFDLSRSIDLHTASTAHTGERAIGGVTSGLIGPGEEVTWHARHLGVWQHLTSRITQYNRPHHFRDTMVRGAFRRFDHDHDFEACAGWTIMRDVFDYTSPLGWLGRLADCLFLEWHMRMLLLKRNFAIKEAAEGEGWRRFLVAPDPMAALGFAQRHGLEVGTTEDYMREIRSGEDDE